MQYNWNTNNIPSFSLVWVRHNLSLDIYKSIKFFKLHTIPLILRWNIERVKFWVLCHFSAFGTSGVQTNNDFCELDMKLLNYSCINYLFKELMWCGKVRSIGNHREDLFFQGTMNVDFLSVAWMMWHKAENIGYPMRIKLVPLTNASSSITRAVLPGLE